MPIRSARGPFVRSAARLAAASAAPLTTAAAVFAASFAAPAHAQCGPRWVHSQAQQYPGALGGSVVDVDTGELLLISAYPYELRKECVVIGGNFTGVGNVAANGVAYWDGENWFNAGAGLAAGAWIDAVGVDEGRIIIAGRDPSSQQSWVKRFDPWSGQTVEELRSPEIYEPTITAIERIEGRLLLFSKVDEFRPAYLSNIVHRRRGGLYYSGTYSPLGSGVSNGTQSVVFAEHQGRTYVGSDYGTFFTKSEPLGSIAIYDQSWSGFDPNDFLSIRGMASWNNELVIAGDLYDLGFGWNVAAHNGQAWRRLPDLPDERFRLHASAFGLIAHDSSREPLKLNGDAWTTLPRQPNTPGVRFLNFSVRDAVNFGNETIFAGDMRLRERYNVLIADRVARYNGSEYLPLSHGLDFLIRKSVLIDDVLYAAGAFIMAGGQRANYVASWDGERWSPMGAGLVSQTAGIEEWQGKPVVSGEFPLPGGQVAHRVCSWDGVQWTPIAPDLSNTFSALTTIDGELYVFGANLQGDADVLRLANGQWEPLPDLGPGRTAFCIASFDGALHVGASAGTVLRLDGQSWIQRGQSLGVGYISDLLEHDGDLLCTYSRLNTNTVEPGGAVFALVGDTWEHFGSRSLFFDGFDLHVHEGRLYAAARSAIGAPTLALLWVLDEDWQPMVGPVSLDPIGYVASLNSVGPELIVSGYFNRVNDRPTGSWSRWNPTGAPRFLEQPQSVITNGELVTLTVRLAPPYNTEATYRWYRDGQPVTQSTNDPPTIQVSRQGNYVCRITIGCASFESQTATIGAPPLECPGDTDRSGQVNFTDVFTVLANFGSAAPGASVLGDANGDGNVNFLDITVVLANFGTSCP